MTDVEIPPKPELSSEEIKKSEPAKTNVEEAASDDSNQNQESEKPEKPSPNTRKDSGSGRSGDERERRRSRNGRGIPWRQRDKKWWVCPDSSCRSRNSVETVTCTNCGFLQNKRTRQAFTRNWEKTRVNGISVTHVISPTTVYIQTPQQQQDYNRLRNCMQQSYASASYRPSLVASKMLLGVKIDDNYERVRTEEKREIEPIIGENSVNNCTSTSDVTNIEWRVQLVDRGSWAWVKEEDLNFLLAGLSDLSPLAEKYTLNELRTKRETTEAALEESRQWLENEIKDATVDADIYRQLRENSPVLYVDLYVGEKLLNRALCELEAVEPKTNLRWLKPQTRSLSTSSQEDANAAREIPPSHQGNSSDQENRNESDNADNDVKVKDNDLSLSTAAEEDSKPRRDRENSGSNRGNRRAVWWGRGKSREDKNRRLPPLQDWAVICFDSSVSHVTLCYLCEMVEAPGNSRDNRMSNNVREPTTIRMEHCEGDVTMESVISEMISAHPRLLLLLCVIPNYVDDYSGLERTGNSLGVCVVCVRGDSIAEPKTSTASRLRRDLQLALLNSPAILPTPSYANGNDRNGRKRRDFRRRNPRRRDSGGNGGRPDQTNDPRLQAVIGAASQGITLLQKLSSLPSGQVPDNTIPPAVKALLETPGAKEDLMKATKSLDDLQIRYKQARTYTHEAFQAAGSFFSHLSTALAPTVVTP